MTDAATVQQEPPALAPNLNQAAEFARLLFEGAEGFVNFRGIEEPAPKTRAARVVSEWVAIDDALPRQAARFVQACAAQGLAAYLLPAPVSHGGGGIKDMLATRFIATDIDEGDIGAKFHSLVSIAGTPWMVVQSGGLCNGQHKLHVYHRLAHDIPSSDAVETEHARAVREALGARVGADSKVAKNPTQILRIAGSLHRKGTAHLAEIRTIDPGARCTLDSLRAALGTAKGNGSDNVVAFNFDFSRDRPHVGTDRLLEESVHEGGVDDLTRFEAMTEMLGRFLRGARKGAYELAEARMLAHGYNQTRIVPPWPPERVEHEFDALLRVDCRNNGPMPSQQQSAPTSFRVKDWSMERYRGKAPIQRWLVDRSFPLGEPGVIAGDGGVGKSFLALDLCLRVASGTKAPAGALDLSQSDIFGGPVVEFGSVVFVTAEESTDALHRRFDAIDPDEKLRAGCANKLWPISLREVKGSRALVAGVREQFAPSEFSRSLTAQLKEFPDLRLVILDPVSAFFGADQSDRAAVQAFADVLSQMASETGATIIALHHMRKDGDDSRGGRKGIFGSAGFVDAFRFAYTLRSSDQAKTKKLASDFQLGDGHGEIIVGSIVKANGGPEGGEHVYERQTTGLLRQLPARVDMAKQARDERRAQLVAVLDWYANRGQPFTKTSPKTGISAFTECLPPSLRGLSGNELERLVDEALRAGELVRASAGNEKSKSWLCSSNSDLAQGLVRQFSPGQRPRWEDRQTS